MARIDALLPREGRFGTMLGVTLWLLGLFVALMTGMLSGYLLATVIFVGSKAYGRLRGAGESEERDELEAEERDKLEAGDRA